jgi:molybdate transport system substrate-binding protein
MNRVWKSSLRRMVLLALVGICGLAQAAGAAEPVKLRVFAAASLGGAFTDLARMFERAHKGVKVQLNLAGSHQLVAQLRQGAVADVFASADERWMAKADSAGLLADSAVTIAHNQLVVIAPMAGPQRVRAIRDLARRGVKVMIGADAVPVGRYARLVLANLERDSTFGRDYAASVLENVVSQEENVKSIVAKVQLGEADAGIVYLSDVTGASSRQVRLLRIPAGANLTVSYPAATLRGALRPDDARAFLAMVRSAEGQKVIERWGLLKVPPQ